MIRKFDLFLLSALLIGMNAWYLHAPYGVSWDNAVRFEVFHFFYNHFYSYKDLPQWMPYYSFGIPSHYWQMAFLAPLSHLGIFLGALFHVTDILFVFKLCLLLEQHIFLFGMYLLSRKFFSSRATVFMVGLGSIASLFSLNQLPYDFFFYYMFPWVMLSFMQFLETRRGEWFWISGIILLTWVMGNSLYFFFVWVPLLLFIGASLIWQQTGWGILRSLFARSRKNLFALTGFLVLGVSIAYPLKNFSGSIDFLTRGAEGYNSLHTFLTYINSGMLQEYCRRFILGDFTASYAGLLLLILFFWGIPRLKGIPSYRVFLLSALGLFWFSFAGVFTAVVYFFPGMAYYRHVGYVYGLIKVLILICAGFSLDAFWKINLKKKIFVVFGGLLGLLFLLDLAELSNPWLVRVAAQAHLGDALAPYMSFESFLWRFTVYIFALLALGVGRSFFAADQARYSFFVKGVLIAALCIDIFSFQYRVYRDVNAVAAPYPREFAAALGTVGPVYREMRTSVPADDRGMKALIALSGAVKYATVHSVAQYSPCESAERLDLQPSFVSRLLSSLKGKTYRAEVLGCGFPKLRLEKDPPISEGARAKDDPEISSPLLLPEQVRVKEFTSHSLTVDVTAPAEGAWLVYADSYHPGWRARVNGVPHDVKRAYIAFKAVFVKGQSTVQFYFYDPLTNVFSHAVMWAGIIVSMIFGGIFVRVLFRNLFR